MIKKLVRWFDQLRCKHERRKKTGNNEFRPYGYGASLYYELQCLDCGKRSYFPFWTM